MLWSLWNIVHQFLKQLNLEFPYDLVIQLLDIYSKKKAKRCSYKMSTICIQVLIVSLFVIAKRWKNQNVHQPILG
jgi:hypothetical protein